jgi:hypothetical protein
MDRAKDFPPTVLKLITHPVYRRHSVAKNASENGQETCNAVSYAQLLCIVCDVQSVTACSLFSDVSHGEVLCGIWLRQSRRYTIAFSIGTQEVSQVSLRSAATKEVGASSPSSKIPPFGLLPRLL